MKKFIFSFLFLAFLITSCGDNVVTQVNPYYSKLVEFNEASGFDARLVSDTGGVVAEAKSWQGQGDYPGVDDWFAVEIDFGAVVLGGLPGQSAFYSILATYYLSGGNKEVYWMMLQVKPHPVFGYRQYLGCYQVNQRIHAAVSKTLANPQFGEGGGWQLYVKDYNSCLTQFSEITLSDTVNTY